MDQAGKRSCQDRRPIPAPPTKNDQPLLIERPEAEAKIKAQIAKGKEAARGQLYSQPAFKVIQQDYYSWEEYVYEMLGVLFSTPKFASEFRGFSFGGGSYHNFAEEVKAFSEDVSHHTSA